MTTDTTTTTETTMATDTSTQPARESGTFRLGGNLPVHRLGFGTMQLPGPGVWGIARSPSS